MSKFIEVNSRACVNSDTINWVEKSEDGLSCTVYTGNREFFCDVPYNSFINMIKSSDVGHDNFHFAG
jgi:hypothetical protein